MDHQGKYRVRKWATGRLGSRWELCGVECNPPPHTRARPSYRFLFLKGCKYLVCNALPIPLHAFTGCASVWGSPHVHHVGEEEAAVNLMTTYDNKDFKFNAFKALQKTYPRALGFEKARHLCESTWGQVPHPCKAGACAGMESRLVKTCWKTCTTPCDVICIAGPGDHFDAIILGFTRYEASGVTADRWHASLSSLRRLAVARFVIWVDSEWTLSAACCRPYVSPCFTKTWVG